MAPGAATGPTRFDDGTGEAAVTAVLAEDVVGHSRLMERDEDGTAAHFRRLIAQRAGQAIACR